VAHVPGLATGKSLTQMVHICLFFTPTIMFVNLLHCLGGEKQESDDGNEWHAPMSDTCSPKTFPPSPCCACPADTFGAGVGNRTELFKSRPSSGAGVAAGMVNGIDP